MQIKSASKEIAAKSHHVSNGTKTIFYITI